MKPANDKPCHECPFRKVHLPGWLGPWTAQDMADHIHRDGFFPCHKTIPRDERETKRDNMRPCAGAAIHMNRAVKRSADPVMAEAQQALKQAPADVIDSVFQWKQDFIDHHTQDLDEWIRKNKETA